MLTDEERQICCLMAKLFDYPSFCLAEQSDKCLEKLKTFPKAKADALQLFVEFCHDHSVSAIQEIYTQTFDMNPKTALYIGHHLFGETPKRNTFMMRLDEEYQATDSFSIGNELPDNLCVLLSFLGVTNNETFAMPLIQDGILPTLVELGNCLDKINNPYAPLLKSLKGFLLGLGCQTESGCTNV